MFYSDRSGQQQIWNVDLKTLAVTWISQNTAGLSGSSCYGPKVSSDNQRTECAIDGAIFTTQNSTTHRIVVFVVLVVVLCSGQAASSASSSTGPTDPSTSTGGAGASGSSTASKLGAASQQAQLAASSLLVVALGAMWANMKPL